MTRTLFKTTRLMALAGVLAIGSTALTHAIDFERFDFNDAPGTTLANAANSANPGNNWTESPGMSPSDVRFGDYNIVKANTTLNSNYLQIDNITGGTRYLVAQLSGWNFLGFDPANQEEFRLAFLNDDTGVSGSTITAQMNLRRNSDGDIMLVGSALGNGSSNIPGNALLSTSQTNPFTMVLELDKTANSYKVFYKDGTNAPQVLGMGSVAPTRNGNSIRMAVNNSFGNFAFDYPFFFEDFLAVDQIRLTDTNPLTDLISLEVNRETGAVLLRNTSGSTVSGIQSYSITSEAGGLNPAGWNSQGTPTASSSFELAATLSTTTNLANGATLSLSNSAGAWLQSPFEDLQMVLNLSGGATRTVNVNFLQNGGEKWQVGDYNFDGEITGADWLAFMANAETTFGGLSPVESYLKGDLVGDGKNSIADFIEFKNLYNTANGVGAFEAMIAGVPEPSSAMLLCMAVVMLTNRRLFVPSR